MSSSEKESHTQRERVTFPGTHFALREAEEEEEDGGKKLHL